MWTRASLAYRPERKDLVMKLKPLVGLALLAVGLIAIVYATWSQDLDPKRAHHVPRSTIVGAVAIAGGVAVLFSGKGATRRLASSR